MEISCWWPLASDFPGKESACSFRRHGFDPWVGKIPCRGKWQLLCSWLGNPMDRGAWGTRWNPWSNWHFHISTGIDWVEIMAVTRCPLAAEQPPGQVTQPQMTTVGRWKVCPQWILRDSSFEQQPAWLWGLFSLLHSATKWNEASSISVSGK